VPAGTRARGAAQRGIVVRGHLSRVPLPAESERAPARTSPRSEPTSGSGALRTRSFFFFLFKVTRASSSTQRARGHVRGDRQRLAVGARRGGHVLRGAARRRGRQDLAERRSRSTPRRDALADIALAWAAYSGLAAGAGARFEFFLTGPAPAGRPGTRRGGQAPPRPRGDRLWVERRRRGPRRCPRRRPPSPSCPPGAEVDDPVGAPMTLVVHR